MNEDTRKDHGGNGNADDDDVYELQDTGEDINQVLAAAVAAEEERSDVEGPDSEALIRAQEEIARLREEADALRDQAVRARADFDNYRKRADREKADYFRYALSGILQDLLAVVDNFERAIETGGTGDEFRTGIEMIHKQFLEVLQRAGLREVPETDLFDPTIHEGVMREENAEVPNNTILQTLQKGYFLHDRLLRPAMVKVASGGADRSSEDEGNG